MRHDNYPDDIRQYDNDPRSPFYSGGDADDFDVWEHPEFLERMNDLNGYFMEAFTESSDEWLAMFKDAVLADDGAKMLTLFKNRLEDYLGGDLEAPEPPEPDYDEDRAWELRQRRNEEY